MPVIKVETNVAMGEDMERDTAKALSALAADMLGKPESYVLAIFEGGKALTFGGSSEPAAYVTLDSIGLPEERTTEFSGIICRFLESAIGVPGDRVYIAFGDIQRNLFGWNEKTF